MTNKLQWQLCTKVKNTVLQKVPLSPTAKVVGVAGKDWKSIEEPSCDVFPSASNKSAYCCCSAKSCSSAANSSSCNKNEALSLASGCSNSDLLIDFTTPWGFLLLGLLLFSILLVDTATICSRRDEVPSDSLSEEHARDWFDVVGDGGAEENPRIGNGFMLRLARGLENFAETTLEVGDAGYT